MRSVPPRGSGWVRRLAIANFRLATHLRSKQSSCRQFILTDRQSAISNQQLAIVGPTRYREVVLTSYHTDALQQLKKLGLGHLHLTRLPTHS